MQVNITFRQMGATDSLKEYVREKVERAEKYLDKAGGAHVVLSVERHLHTADITIHSGAFVLRGKERSEDMYASIDLAMDKIERQIRRYKDRLKNHHGKAWAHHQAGVVSQRIRHDIVALPEPDEQKVDEASPRIVRTDEFEARPMSVEDAVMQMDLMNKDFLVFSNVQSNEINVVYRRKDGHYGLIDPSASKVRRTG